MKTGGISLLALLLALLLAMGGCGGQSPAPSQPAGEGEYQGVPPVPDPPQPVEYRIDPRLPQMVRQVVAQNREAVFLPLDDGVKEETRLLLTAGLDPAEDARIAPLVEANRYRSEEQYKEMLEQIPQSLTHRQAEEEIGFLFDYLKYGYCGYGYFGGDPVFQRAEEEMLAALAQLPDPVAIFDYKYKVLLPGLEPYIRDSHFSLDSDRFTASYEKPFFCYNEELSFTKTDRGFETLLKEVPHLLTAADGEDPEDWMLPFLDQEGRAVWVAGGTFAQGEPVKVELTLQNLESGEEVVHPLELAPMDFSYREAIDQEASGYALTEEEGIPVMVNRRLYSLSGNLLEKDDEQLEAMVEGAAALREEPVLIIDLRGNGGGDDSYCFRWMQNYADTPLQPQYGVVSTALLTETVRSSADWIAQFLGEQFEGAEENDPPYWRELVCNPAKLTPNDNLVFVLMDNAVASSGESFVASLREMENVVLVGTNTAGCGTMGNVRGVFLPESKLMLNCGINLFLPPDLSLFEGVGYQPDLWAPPGESLERVLALIKSLDG